MADEARIQAAIRKDSGSEPGVVLYRNQVGRAVYTRKDTGQEFTVPYGLCKGSSDLIGWRSRIITPDMVGQTFAQFVAIEVKDAKRKSTEEQRMFVALVLRSGGLAGVARSEEQAREILGL
jgi:hypothetical protein